MLVGSSDWLASPVILSTGCSLFSGCLPRTWGLKVERNDSQKMCANALGESAEGQVLRRLCSLRYATAETTAATQKAIDVTERRSERVALFAGGSQ